MRGLRTQALSQISKEGAKRIQKLLHQPTAQCTGKTVATEKSRPQTAERPAQYGLKLGPKDRWLIETKVPQNAIDDGPRKACRP